MAAGRTFGKTLAVSIFLAGFWWIASPAARAQSGLPPVDRPGPTQPPRPFESQETDEAGDETADETAGETAGETEAAARPRRAPLTRAAAPALEAEMALQRRLLAEDLLRYTGLRESERRRWQQVDDLKTGLDIALAGEELLLQSEALSEVQVAETRLESAVGEAQNAGSRARELRRQMVERVRKIHLLERELARLTPAAERAPDPLSGRWEITYRPDLLTGIFDLVLDGTQVSGRYRLSSGRQGSLRGRFTGRELHLERIDRERGFDAVFEGTLDPEEERITGFWRPTDLSGGASGGGDWWAERPDEESLVDALTDEPGESEEETP